ncbi:gas vesicle protein GvpJ [Portibacter marinus]|uniref:gas vesicle protein GvpJ n=1 Tax=Portibacter marinus TaxID=2898660 RepID=UPI001F42F8C0|nr:gas vesicle protein GvpJ [Portibacter marinus]
MSAATTQVIRKEPSSGSLKDVIEVILDKGLVIDAYVRVSLIGIELLTIDARIIVASLDTYLRYARAVDRLDLRQKSNGATLANFISSDDDGDSMSENVGEEIVDEAIERIVGSSEKDDD